MRKRDRLKNRLQRLMGGPSEVQPPAAAPPKPAPAPVPKEAAEAPADPEAEEMAKKAAKHFERTRVAMLKFVIEQGGQASMADMHELSERRYFIGHKRFSDLMEGIVGEGLIDFDHASGVAQITDAGAAYVAK